MAVAEKINERVQQLPERAQAEVLNFVEYLLVRSEQAQGRREWSEGSLALALRGMEDDGPEYTDDDLTERFS